MQGPVAAQEQEWVVSCPEGDGRTREWEFDDEDAAWSLHDHITARGHEAEVRVRVITRGPWKPAVRPGTGGGDT